MWRYQVYNFTLNSIRCVSTYRTLKCFPPLKGKEKIQIRSRRRVQKLQTTNFQFSILSLKRKGIGFCRVMAEPSRNMEVERLISYTDDLVKVLVEPRDLNNLSYCHQQNLSLSSSSHSHHHDVRSSLQGLCQYPFFDHRLYDPFRYLSMSDVANLLLIFFFI